MVDKLTTVPRANLGNQIGRLSDQDPCAWTARSYVFLGLA
jgi:hypothetical protein